MRVPHSLIVPDSKPPLLLMGLGATLLAGVIIRALRRRQARTAPARDSVVNSTGKTVRQSSSTRAKPRTQALLVSSLAATPRVKTARVPVGERS
ncbi:hypothetical protein [Hyalangium sp.]|uniref:hypothetical protein n=1 Tax=Hyalangium sp. TaxID=2028555 RepID=UPI002D66D07C|nr:hypothetical protein [Hyalangium sp.]HYH97788.1 hypothetical protein [Hyalangium sp.]